MKKGIRTTIAALALVATAIGMTACSVRSEQLEKGYNKSINDARTDTADAWVDPPATATLRQCVTIDDAEHSVEFNLQWTLSPKLTNAEVVEYYNDHYASEDQDKPLPDRSIDAIVMSNLYDSIKEKAIEAFSDMEIEVFGPLPLFEEGTITSDETNDLPAWEVNKLIDGSDVGAYLAWMKGEGAFLEELTSLPEAKYFGITFDFESNRDAFLVGSSNECAESTTSSPKLDGATEEAMAGLVDAIIEESRHYYQQRDRWLDDNPND